MSCKCHQDQCLYARRRVGSCKFGVECSNFIYCHCIEGIPGSKNKGSKFKSKKYASRGGGGGSREFKTIVNFSEFQVSSDKLYTDPSPQKMPNIPRMDISTIKSYKDLEKTKEVYWTKDGEELGVYEKRVIEDNGSSIGNQGTFFALQFSKKKWIPEERLFPPAQVAVSSSGGGGGSVSTTAKVGGSVTTIANVGGGRVLPKTIIFTNNNNMANLVVGDSYTDKTFGKDKIGVFVKSQNKDSTNTFHVFFLIDGIETEFKVRYGGVLLKIIKDINS